MTATVKTPALLGIFFISTIALNAQLKIPGNANITSDIKKVIDDYPNHFVNLLGEVIIQNPQSTDYRCNFKVNGAEECSITRYSGTKNPASWQALMLTTDDFDEAKKKFKSIFGQLNNFPLRSMHLKGQYESPVEEKKFASITFSFSPSEESVSKLQVELLMEADMMEWKVRILIYDRERSDDERGQVIE
jgi:hypothetical protein